MPFSLLEAICLLLVYGLGVAAQFKMVALSGPVVGKLRYDISGSGDGQLVHLYRDALVSWVIMTKT